MCGLQTPSWCILCTHTPGPLHPLCQGPPQGDILGLPVTPKASPDAACDPVLMVTNVRASSCYCGLW